MNNDIRRQIATAASAKLVPHASQDEKDAFVAGAEFRQPEIDALNARVQQLEIALEKIADTVDEGLLLDEQLADAWDVLRTAVIDARATLVQSAPKEKK